VAFKRGNVFQIDRKPPGYRHRIGPLSTFTTSRRVAEQMEATIVELAALGMHDPLDAVREGRITIPELHTHKVRGTLGELMRDRVDDPPLRKAVSDFRSGLDDLRYLPVLQRLLETAPENARTSWLADPENIRRLIRRYRNAGLSGATERREMAGISRLVRECLGESRRREIFSELTLRRPDRGRTRWLTRDEIVRLKEKSGDWWVLFQLAIATGLRRGEILGLRVADISFDFGTLIVQRGKSARARRVVPLAGEPLGAVRRWVDENQLESSDLLFPDVTNGGLRHAWEQARDAAGLAGVRFHDFRHTYAVHCAKAGMPLVELQQRLGHATITMTMRYAVYAPPVMSAHHQMALEGLGLA
jgi:integrase